MKWFGGATIMLVLLWLFVYGYANRYADLRYIAQDIDKYRKLLADLKAQVKDPEALKEEGLRLDELRKSLASKEETLGAKYGDVQCLEAKKEALSVECGECANEISSKMQEVERLKKDVEKLQVESDSIRKKKDVFAKERDSVLEEMTTAEKNRDRYQMLANGEKSRYEELREQVTIAHREIANAKVESARLKTEHDQWVTKITAAKKELDNLQAGVVDLKAKKAEFATIMKRLITLVEEIELKTLEKEQLVREVKKLAAEKDLLAAELQKENIDLDEAVKKRSARDIEKQIEQIETRILDRIEALGRRITEVEKKGDVK